MQAFILKSCALIILLSVAVCAVAFYLGRRVFTLQDLNSLPFLGNHDNTAWIQEQLPKKSFSFLVLGDIQAGHANLLPLLQIADKRYDFAVQTGDLVSHADKGHYALALHALATSDLQVPLFVVPGNHDVKGNPELFDIYFKGKQFYFVWSDSLFIFLDNALGAPYDRLFQFLEETLQKHRETVRLTFIFIHRPPIDWEHGEPQPETKNYSRFFEIQKTYKIDYVFSGHLHDYRTFSLDGTDYISNGLESDQTDNASQECYATLVNVSPEKVVLTKVSLQPVARAVWRGRMLDFLVAHVYPSLMRLLH